jgi:hypothetical protein
MSERSEIERAIGLFFEALNTNDASIIPLADDVVMSGPMMPEPINGEAAVRQYIDETSPFMARIDQISTIIEGENAAIVVEFEGLNGVIFKGVEIFRVANGLICSDQVFFDTRPLLKGKN